MRSLLRAKHIATRAVDYRGESQATAAEDKQPKSGHGLKLEKVGASRGGKGKGEGRDTGKQAG